MVDLFTTTGATFSPCRHYRYRLWRIWDDRPVLNVCMLNPSTADETVNDPTVARCEQRARQLGYGGLVVTNLFALRSTDPHELYKVEDPIGPDNDVAILEAAKECGLLICGWGIHGKHLGRGKVVLEMLRDYQPNCLGLTKSGEPRHPLYLSYELKPVLFRAE